MYRPPCGTFTQCSMPLANLEDLQKYVDPPHLLDATLVSPREEGVGVPRPSRSSKYGRS